MQLLHRAYSRTPVPIVQQGLQGREIWSLDLHPLTGGGILCATSAEDTTVKISLVQAASGGIEFETVYRWPDVDGTLQNVKWAPSACGSETALLFVTSKESLYALCVSLPAEKGHRRLRLNVRPAGRAAKTEERNEDSRIMALDIVKCKGRHVLLAGYSDGFLHWWEYREVDETFRVLHATAWHDRCLLSVKVLIDRDQHIVYAASGATDGRRGTPSKCSELSLMQNICRIAIWQYRLADLTNTHLEAAKNPSAVCEKVHQSGVNCLDIRTSGVYRRSAVTGTI